MGVQPGPARNVPSPAAAEFDPFDESDTHAIKMPGAIADAVVPKGPEATVYFDGGCQGPPGQRTGTTGWVAYDVEGKQIEGVGQYHGKLLTTNNEAEAAALQAALAFITANGDRLRAKVVRVIGDSRLLTDFINRRARPGTAFLVQTIPTIRALIR